MGKRDDKQSSQISRSSTCFHLRTISIKENYELETNISSKVLAFAFSHSTEIERQLISQRTKEAQAKKNKRKFRSAERKMSVRSRYTP